MAIEKILRDWKNKRFAPVYWLEGEEEYYIDKLVDYAEHNILPESEATFNLSVLYGRDTNWADVINACRRYPMFAEMQVVIVKEAQYLREIDKLEAYVQNPLSSTVLIVAYKEKKLDARTKFYKLLKQHATVFTTKKMKDEALPGWVNETVNSMGYTITPKANALLTEHIGNDLNRIENEIEKIFINLKGRKSITEEDIEQFVGISKEYNVFELQSAMANKDFPKAMKIVQYFEANPKAASIQQVLPLLYTFFSKVYMIFGVSAEADIAGQIGVPSFYISDYKNAAKIHGFGGIKKILILLHQYNLKSIGINTVPLEDGELMKELVVKSMM